MRLQYTAATPLNLAPLGLGVIAQNGIFDIPRISYESLSAFSPLSNFTFVGVPPTLNTPVGFNPPTYNSGLFSARPLAGQAGRLYFATDTGVNGGLYVDTGSTWTTVSPGLVGGISEASLLPATTPALNAMRMCKSTYDFTVLGGATGTLPLTGGTIPINSLVVAGLCEVITAPTTGSTTTIALQVEGANDVITAASVAGAPWSTTGRKAIVPVWSDLTKTIRTTAARVPSAVIGTAAATAGKFDLFLLYFVSE